MLKPQTTIHLNSNGDWHAFYNELKDYIIDFNKHELNPENNTSFDFNSIPKPYTIGVRDYDPFETDPISFA